MIKFNYPLGATPLNPDELEELIPKHITMQIQHGNGRHARLMTDILLVNCQCSRFTWGSQKNDSFVNIRKEYIQALRTADRHDYDLLFRFVRS